jgi:hypothetical protein
VDDPIAILRRPTFRCSTSRATIVLPNVVGAIVDAANESVGPPQGQRRRRRPNILSHMVGTHGVV